MLSRTSNSAKYVEEYSLELKQFLDSQPTKHQECQIGDLNDTQEVVMRELKVIDYSNGSIVFSFKVNTAGDYYIFTSINEKMVDCVASVSIADNPDGDDVPDTLEAEYERAMLQAREEEEREEREKERQFMAMKRRQAEEEARRAEEELIQKTKGRAEYNLKQHLMDKKIKELREIQAKKERADLRVGGGFNLDKYSSKIKSERGQEVTLDMAKALVQERKRKEMLKNSEMEEDRYQPEEPYQMTASQSRNADRQMSQYQGVNGSEYNDTDIDPSEIGVPGTPQLSNHRPGSGYKIREISLKKSRPSSRIESGKQTATLNNFDLMNNVHGGSFAESQLISRNETSDTMRRQPVKAFVRTGDKFFNAGEMVVPELAQSRDLRDSKGFGNVKEKLNHAIAHERQSSSHSQVRDAVGSSQSNRKSFKIASSSTKPLRRGMSQEKPRNEASNADDKTAPKKSKGGMSLQRKADSSKMPVIGATNLRAGNAAFAKAKRR